MRSVQRSLTPRVRKSGAGDADYLARFTEDELDQRDTILLAESNGEIVGHLAVRLIPVVHGFHVSPSLIQRRVADALLQYAKGYVAASQMSEALLFVKPDNAAMMRWIEQSGARQEEAAHIYTMEVR